MVDHIDAAVAAYTAERQLWVLIPHRDVRHPAIAHRYAKPQQRSRISSALPEKILYDEFNFTTEEARDAAVLRACLEKAIYAATMAPQQLPGDPAVAAEAGDRTLRAALAVEHALAPSTTAGAIP